MDVIWHDRIRMARTALNVRVSKRQLMFSFCGRRSVVRVLHFNDIFIYCMLFYSLYVQLLSFSFTVICVHCVFYCLLPSGVLNKQGRSQEFDLGYTF